MKHHNSDTGTTTITPERQRAGERFESRESAGDQQEVQRRVEAAATPGPAHKALNALVGNWKAEVKCWPEEGGPPSVSQATAKTHWTLADHFLEEEFHGEMMGKPFTGRSWLGYDNTKQTYKMVWVSDAQTSMFVCEGKGQDANKVIALEGRTSCAGTGRTDVPMKTVFRVLGPDKHVFEMYDESRGANAKAMEITYTRQ